MTQLLAHLFGDYILQSDWMATQKTSRTLPAAVHALTYMLPFLFLTQSWKALSVIVVTHFIIDRWRLVRYLIWVKNFISPLRFSPEMLKRDPLGIECPSSFEASTIEFDPTYVRPWRECSGTGYHESRPAWLATWLMIIADNTLHLLCNYIALEVFR